MTLPTVTAAAGTDADRELVELWHEFVDLWNSDTPAEDAKGRIDEIRTAIERARPVSPLGLAVQARYLEHDLDIGSCDSQIELAGAIGAALTRLAGVEVRRNPDILRWDQIEKYDAEMARMGTVERP